MAYNSDKTPQQLTELPSLEADDVVVVGDDSDGSERAKGIKKAGLATTLPVWNTGSGTYATLTVSTTAPTNPQVNDLWLEIT